MGRLSAYAKNRILKLRFKKNKRIIHIVDILKRDDNIKVSRQAVSTFLKKYLETNSIYDKPRTGRKRKLTQEEIQLIGQVTRLNRDITARAIKEYLNLNVSTYTILRATKLFEWNKVNPNSNDSKKQAALERQGDQPFIPTSKTRSSSATRTTRKYTKRKSANITMNENEDELANQTNTDLSFNNEDENGEIEKIQLKPLNNQEMNKKLKQAAAAAAAAGLNGDTSLDTDNNASLLNPPVVVKHRNSANAIPDFEKVDLNMIPHRELLILKNLSCSPMSFATKILFKIFKIEELHGHNVSGKTLNKNLKSKLPLDPIRIGYIKFLVEKYYDEKECKEMLHGATSTKQDLWKSCHTAINKSILISERKAALAKENAQKNPDTTDQNLDDSKSKLNENSLESNSDLDQSKNVQKHKPMQKKRRRRRSYSSSGDDEEDDDDVDNLDSSTDEEFDHNLLSEEFDSDDSENEEDDEIELNTRFSSNQKNLKKKLKQKSDNDSDSDNSDTESVNSEHQAEFANEIELIQNIENRLINPKKDQTEPIEEQKSKQEEESSEESAAAKIAAAMKKRFVIVASTDSANNSTNNTDQATEKQQASEKAKKEQQNTSKKSPPQKLNKLKQATTQSKAKQVEVEIKKEPEEPEIPIVQTPKTGRIGRPKKVQKPNETEEKEREKEREEKEDKEKEQKEQKDEEEEKTGYMTRRSILTRSAANKSSSSFKK